jgi:hypothetical protein
MFHNWVTPANAQEEFRGNPPGPIYPTFSSDGAIKPLFVLGNSNTPPFGFTYPAVPGQPLDSHGGVVGLQPPIGAIDPNLKTPVSYNFTGNVERRLARDTVVMAGYSGARGRNLLSGGGQQFSVSYGVDINNYAGDLIQHNSTVPTRLNPSFGAINYTQNDRQSSFNSAIFGVRARFAKNGFVNAYYTRSSSKDDTQVYPVATNPYQYYGPSIWDAANRLSLTCSYTISGLNHGNGLAGRLTGGWTASGTTILQSGQPFTVNNTASFQPVRDASGKITGFSAASGDYNADGFNNDYPNVANYNMGNGRHDYLTGVFPKSNFTTPALGTEGNERWGQFRNPGFAETDASLSKETRITERLRLQLRFEFFNIFNRVNLNGVSANLSSSTFGRATSQLNPRWIQIGARISF